MKIQRWDQTENSFCNLETFNLSQKMVFIKPCFVYFRSGTGALAIKSSRAQNHDKYRDRSYFYPRLARNPEGYSVRLRKLHLRTIICHPCLDSNPSASRYVPLQFYYLFLEGCMYLLTYLSTFLITSEKFGIFIFVFKFDFLLWMKIIFIFIFSLVNTSLD